jgi:hypothetical protein
MAIKLGNTTASLYLGATPVAAYLGAEQVYSAVQAATLYFDGAVDNDWAEVGNWWLDDEHTEPAGRLPTSADSVVATASITASGQTVVDFTISGTALLLGTLTVTGNATFNESSQNGGSVTGNATFNESSQNNSGGGGIVGNATFTGSSINYGPVTGTATFSDSACNDDGTAGTFVPDPPPSC